MKSVKNKVWECIWDQLFNQTSEQVRYRIVDRIWNQSGILNNNLIRNNQIVDYIRDQMIEKLEKSYHE